MMSEQRVSLRRGVAAHADITRFVNGYSTLSTVPSVRSRNRKVLLPSSLTKEQAQMGTDPGSERIRNPAIFFSFRFKLRKKKNGSGMVYIECKVHVCK